MSNPVMKCNNVLTSAEVSFLVLERAKIGFLLLIMLFGLDLRRIRVEN